MLSGKREWNEVVLVLMLYYCSKYPTSHIIKVKAKGKVIVFTQVKSVFQQCGSGGVPLKRKVGEQEWKEKRRKMKIQAFGSIWDMPSSSS